MQTGSLEAPARPRRRAALGAAGVLAAGVLAFLLAERPAPAPRPPPLLHVRLGPCEPDELWEPEAATPADGALHYALLDSLSARARAELASGKIDRALLTLHEALAEFPRHPDALAALARHHIAVRDRPKLRSVLRALEIVQPGSPALASLQAEAALLDGDAETARRLLQPLLDSGAPIDARARLLAAALAFEAGDLDASRRLFDAVDSRQLDLPDATGAWLRLGAALAAPASGISPAAPASGPSQAPAR
jgi:tetratricopeptide (TPR) repeat protein